MTTVSMKKSADWLTVVPNCDCPASSTSAIDTPLTMISSKRLVNTSNDWVQLAQASATTRASMRASAVLRATAAPRVWPLTMKEPRFAACTRELLTKQSRE